MDDQPNFEDALRQLERIVDDLERGEDGLSEALTRYERGVRLLAHCHGMLDRAEQSVALLTGVDEAGNPVTAPLDPAEAATATADGENTTPPAPTPARKSRKRPSTTAVGEDDDGKDRLIPF